MNPVGNITIAVKDMKTGNPIPQFKYIINHNNVGDPQVELPVEERSQFVPLLKTRRKLQPCSCCRL